MLVDIKTLFDAYYGLIQHLASPFHFFFKLGFHSSMQGFEYTETSKW